MKFEDNKEYICTCSSDLCDFIEAGDNKHAETACFLDYSDTSIYFLYKGQYYSYIKNVVAPAVNVKYIAHTYGTQLVLEGEPCMCPALSARRSKFVHFLKQKAEASGMKLGAGVINLLWEGCCYEIEVHNKNEEVTMQLVMATITDYINNIVNRGKTPTDKGVAYDKAVRMTLLPEIVGTKFAYVCEALRHSNDLLPSEIRLVWDDGNPWTLEVRDEHDQWVSLKNWLQDVFQPLDHSPV